MIVFNSVGKNDDLILKFINEKYVIIFIEMKGEIRVIGIDDSPFNFDDEYSNIIGVVMRGGEYIECILKSTVEIDGNDATKACIKIINDTKHKMQLKAILLDGISLGGFNVVDIKRLYNSTNIPVITVTRDEPDFEKIERALKKNFKDWDKRLILIKKGTLHKVKTSHNPIFIKCVGITLSEAKEIIKISTIRGVIPEPIRVAHLIASGIKRGDTTDGGDSEEDSGTPGFEILTVIAAIGVAIIALRKRK